MGTSGRLGARLLLWCLLGLSITGRASAQKLPLDHYSPAPVPTDGFAVSRPEGLQHLKLGGFVQLDYSHDPLVFRDANGDEKSIIKHDLVGHASLSLGLWDKLTLFVGLPVNLVMKGDIGTPDGPGIGDAWLGGRYTLLGGERVFALGAEAIARLPTAELADDKQRQSGDEKGSYELALLGEARKGRLAIGTRVGVRLRKEQQLDQNLDIGSELMLAGYLRLRFFDELYGTAEVFGNTPFASFFYKRATPVEALFGFKYFASAAVIGAAGGPGLSRGYGSPEYRFIGSLGYAPRAKKPEPPKDSDGDGYLDNVDRCVHEPEDRDGFEDEDGCPDPDNDGDGIADMADQCAGEAEDKDGFEDEDGCPDPDNDRDGLADADDKCPGEAEDQDAFEDQDGCLDPDNDGDGVLDGADKCPLEPGTPELEGCQPPPIAVLEKGEIRILQRIEFEVNKDRLLPESEPVLEAVRSVLEKNPEVQKVRVEGHTDNTGSEKRNLDLSGKRAVSVSKWLIEHGVAPERLEAAGCGPRRPLEPNITAEGKQKNRRVEFHLVDPAPAEPVDFSVCKVVQIK